MNTEQSLEQAYCRYIVVLIVEHGSTDIARAKETEASGIEAEEDQPADPGCSREES